MQFLERLFEILHKGMVVRRAIIFWSLWFTTTVAFKTFDLITKLAESNADGAILQSAAIIGAVYTPLFAFQGAVLKFYAQYKYQDGE